MRSHILSLRLLTIIIFCCLLTNCATVVSERYQELTINSSPSQADIYIDGIYKGKTPSIVKVKTKKSELDILVKKNGYEPEGMIVDHKVLNPWVLGNILFGGFGLVGTAIDYTSGSLLRFNTRRVSLILEPKIQQFNGNPTISSEEDHNTPYAMNKISRSGPIYSESIIRYSNKESDKSKYQLTTKMGPRLGLMVFNRDMHEFISDSIANDESLDPYFEDHSKKVAQVVSMFGMNLEQEAVFEGFPHELFYGLLPFVGGFDQGFYMLGLDMLGGVRLDNGLEVSLGPSFTMIDKSIGLGIGYNLDYGAVQVPFKLTVNQTPRGSRFSFSSGISW
ncbi:MAG: PEGA domain-containing protein [Oligoflexales bacterium]